MPRSRIRSVTVLCPLSSENRPVSSLESKFQDNLERVASLELRSFTQRFVDTSRISFPASLCLGRGHEAYSAVYYGPASGKYTYGPCAKRANAGFTSSNGKIWSITGRLRVAFSRLTMFFQMPCATSAE
jgi:hypothetical protein